MKTTMKVWSGYLLGSLLLVWVPCVAVGSGVDKAVGEAVVHTLSNVPELSLFRRAMEQAGIATTKQQEDKYLRSGESYPFQECEGLCESNSDCQKGLICPRRRSGERVPGCLGTSQIISSSYSYCTRADLLGFGSHYSSQEVTVFAPVDSAFQADGLFRSVAAYSASHQNWYGHLQRLVLNQFVEGGTFSKHDMFDGTIGSNLLTMEGQSIRIDEDQETIAGQALVALESNTSSSEEMLVRVGSSSKPQGIIHPVEGFFVHSDGWIEQTIWDLIEQPNSGGSDALTSRQKRFLTERLAKVQEQELMNALRDFSDGGMTLLVPSDASLVEMDETDSLDEDRTILYNMVTQNQYAQHHDDGECIQMTTLHPQQPMQPALMAYRNIENGTLQYGNAMLTQEIFANNGLIHVTDQIVRPPKVLELLSDYPCLPDFAYCYKLLNATGTMESVQQQMSAEKSFTVWCPVTTTRFSTPVPSYVWESPDRWSKHLETVASYMIEAGITTTYDNERRYPPSDLVGPSSVRGIDGVANLCDHPVWRYADMRNAIELHLGYSYYSRLSSSFRDTLYGYRSQAPITVFVPPSLPEPFLQDDRKFHSRNHIFVGNWYVEDLLKMDGKVLTSINEMEWLVSVLDDNVFLQAWDGTEAMDNVAPVKVGTEKDSTNILASNGVAHLIDAPLLVAPVVTKSLAMAACVQEIDAMESCSPYKDSYYINSVGTTCYDDQSCASFAVETVQKSWSRNKMCSILTCSCCRRGCENQHQALVTCLVKKATGDDLSSCDAPYCSYSKSSSRYGDSSDDEPEPWVWVLVCSALAVLIAIVAALIWCKLRGNPCTRSPRTRNADRIRNVERSNPPTKATCCSLLALTIVVGLVAFYLGSMGVWVLFLPTLAVWVVTLGALMWCRLRGNPCMRMEWSNESTKNTSFSVLSLTLALLGLLTFYLGFLLGPLAIIFGAVAWARIRHKPDEFGGKCQATTGIALGFICLVGYSTMLVMFAVEHWDPDNYYYSSDDEQRRNERLIAVGLSTLALASVTACCISFYYSQPKPLDEDWQDEEAGEQEEESLTINLVDEGSGPSDDAGDGSHGKDDEVTYGVMTRSVFSDES